MLQFYIPTDIMWKRLRTIIPEEKHNMSQIWLRIIMVAVVTGTDQTNIPMFTVNFFLGFSNCYCGWRGLGVINRPRRRNFLLLTRFFGTRRFGHHRQRRGRLGKVPLEAAQEFIYYILGAVCSCFGQLLCDIRHAEVMDCVLFSSTFQLEMR